MSRSTNAVRTAMVYTQPDLRLLHNASDINYGASLVDLDGPYRPRASNGVNFNMCSIGHHR